MRRTYGMQLTIDKYTQLVAPLDVRGLDLALRGLAGLELSAARSGYLPASSATTGAKGSTSSAPTIT